MKKTALGFTLIELLVVITLIGLVVIPLIFGIRQTGQTQNMRTSVSVLSDDLQTVKVSSREARDKVGWGVISTGPTSYEIVKGNKTAPTPVYIRSLQNGVSFQDQFALWFEIGTGNVTPAIIQLKNMNNQKYSIEINALGTITVTQL